MARVKGAMMTRKRRKKVLKLAKGYFGANPDILRWLNRLFTNPVTMLTSAVNRKNVTSEDFGSPESLQLAVQTTFLTLYSSMV